MNTSLEHAFQSANLCPISEKTPLFPFLGGHSQRQSETIKPVVNTSLLPVPFIFHFLLTAMNVLWVLISLLFIKNALSTELSANELHQTPSKNHSILVFRVVNAQLSNLKHALTTSNVTLFRRLFDESKVKLGSVFQPDFLHPNNVFASMGDSEFKNSLSIFTSFQPSSTEKGSLRALISIRYKLDGHVHRMDKEVFLSKGDKSPTGYVFAGFQAV